MHTHIESVPSHSALASEHWPVGVAVHVPPKSISKIKIFWIKLLGICKNKMSNNSMNRYEGAFGAI